MRFVCLRSIWFLTALTLAGGTIDAAALPLTPYRYESQAQRHCPDDTVVWLDFRKRIYYFKKQETLRTGLNGELCLPRGSACQPLSSLIAWASVGRTVADGIARNTVGAASGGEIS